MSDLELLSRNGENNSLGCLDEIRLYNKALTVTEISGLAIQPTLNTLTDLSTITHSIRFTRYFTLNSLTNKSPV